ncbi:hypothetical protein Acr_00g0022880 [Actinidia rufa]|uniref:Uncharacterized protein n=1 Tax=Actinidia rufa TaxID=165716 RepID=A0A7J0DCZ2_9ERIC|nr:hypothetical protein Acr_00g0022880 [Actinidia rufa]
MKRWRTSMPIDSESVTAAEAVGRVLSGRRKGGLALGKIGEREGVFEWSGGGGGGLELEWVERLKPNRRPPLMRAKMQRWDETDGLVTRVLIRRAPPSDQDSCHKTATNGLHGLLL